MSDNNKVQLFQEQIGTLEIKKHSSLVQMNNITTLQQRKTMNAFIYIAKDQLKRNPDRKLFSTELGLLKRLA